MARLPKQVYTAEFKVMAIQRAKSGAAISAVARELGIYEQTLRYWLRQDKAGKLAGQHGRVVTTEEMELSQVRAENARLKMEIEILKKATAYFAKDVL